MDKKPLYELSEEELAYITRFLNGELDVAGVAAFERRLETDADWQQKVLEVKALLIGIREANLVDQLAAWRKETDPGKPMESGPPVRPLYRRWWVAASVAALILFGIWRNLSNPADERLYQTYFAPDAGLPVPMSGMDTIRYTFYDGMISYKEEKYADALAKWASVGRVTDTIRYFSGIANMGLGQMGEAVAQLLQVSDDPHSAFNKEATWYLGLCYLRQGKRETAVSLLKRIDDDGRAQALLKKLE